MKKILFIGLILSCLTSFSQPWLDFSPEKKSARIFSFFDHQQAFINYWEGIQIDENGYYIKDGIEVKAYGWKQFKRWESFYEYRVDKQTGTFPTSLQINRANEQYTNSLITLKSAADYWESMGPFNFNGGEGGVGRINRIAFHPSDINTFWVTTPGGGLWKTSDAGSTWTVLTDELETLATTAVAIPSDYATSKTVYLGTGDLDGWYKGNGIGIFKSTDDGQSWDATGLKFNVADNISVNKILIHPDNDSILYAATSKGIYKTTDAGDNWAHIYNENWIGDLEFKPGDPSIIYASSKKWGIVYKTANNGASWVKRYAEFWNEIGARRVELAVTPVDPDIVYAVVANEESGLKEIIKSTNSGSSFYSVFKPANSPTKEKPNILSSKLHGDKSGGQAWFDLAIAADPNNADILYCGGINTWKSTDGGETWKINNYRTSWDCDYCEIAHCDKHCLAFNNSVLYECNDGGLEKTIDGVIWDNISNGIVNSEIRKIGVSQSDSNLIIAGLQDNGSKLLEGNGKWRDVLGGDGIECFIDPNNADIMYASSQKGSIFRTYDRWNSKTKISNNGPDETGDWMTTFTMSFKTPGKLFIALENVWKSINRGDSWTKISNINSENKLRYVVIAPSSEPYICTGDNQHLWRTTNGGNKWEEITNWLPVSENSITSVAIKNDDPNTIWVTLGQFNSNVVYQSVNGGETWLNISAGLPDIPANTIVQNKQNNAEVELYVGTDYGVYKKLGNSEWQLFNAGMPKVAITELDIFYDKTNDENSILNAATYGRGVWQTKLDFSTTSSLDLDEEQIMIFPNPAKNYIQVEMPNQLFASAKRNNPNIEVFDISGKLIKQIQVKSKQTRIDISNIEKGIYLLKININNRTFTRKFINE